MGSVGATDIGWRSSCGIASGQAAQPKGDPSRSCVQARGAAVPFESNGRGRIPLRGAAPGDGNGREGGRISRLKILIYRRNKSVDFSPGQGSDPGGVRVRACRDDAVGDGSIKGPGNVSRHV